MARGPGSVAKLKLPTGWPATAPFIVWSYSDGQWWRVGQAGDLHTAQVDAAQRLLNTSNGTRGNRVLGTNPLKPRQGGRFVATARGDNPQTEWETIHGL